MSSTTKTDKLKEAHDRLSAAVEAIVTGDDWQRMLKVAAKFHRYSFNNQLMIFLQRPDATLVAGFRRWQELGRFVKKGEKGIAIFAPCRYKSDPPENGPSAASPGGKGASQTQSSSAVSGSALAVEVAAPPGDRPKTEVIRGFRVVHVFDIAQTEGDEIPDLDAVRPQLLDGDAPEGVWEALVNQTNAIDFEVVREQKGSENGFCDVLNKTIAVRPDVSPGQAVKTLIHELAHALLHSEESPKSREIAEVEVESVAFVVLDALGMASDDYSFPYVARWSGGDIDIMKETGERVMSCGRTILTGFDATQERKDSDFSVKVGAQP